MENFENNNIKTDENIGNTAEIIVEPQLVDDYKNCIFCNEKIGRDMLFCSFCGKPQKEEIRKEEPEKRSFKRKIKKKRKAKKGILYLIFACVFFSLSLLCMLIGIYRMNFMNVTTISLFGSNSDTLIVNQTHVIGNLILSFIFLFTGVFFVVLKSIKALVSGFSIKSNKSDF